MPISPLRLAFFVALAAALSVPVSIAAPGPGKWLSKDPQTSTGTWQSDKGPTYVGGYSGDEWHGRGTLTFLNGDSYEAIYEHDTIVTKVRYPMRHHDALTFIKRYPG